MLKRSEYEELKKVLIEEVGKEMFEKGDRLELKRMVKCNIVCGNSKFNDLYKEYTYKGDRGGGFRGRRWDVVDYDRFYRMLKRLRNM